MKSIFTFIIILISTTIVSAQCMIEPWSLEKRVTNSTTIVEARVIAKECTWDVLYKNIYTINRLEVYNVFKGSIRTETIQLITEGGVVGTEMLRVSPSLTLELGDVGVFMLKDNEVGINRESKLYQPYASVQSFIQYDLNSVEAFDLQKTYTSIVHDLYDDITQFTQSGIESKKEFDPEAAHKKIRALAPPTITSFSTSTATSGTSTELIINGSNFGFARGSGAVGFKDANFGDGRYYYSPTGWSYTSWSNSQIKVIIPTRAGTGKVQVINNGGETGESSSDLTIEWAHLNVNYPQSATDTPFFELQHVDDNGNGGYTWQMTPSFSNSTDAVAAFTRSLNEWKCETQMNWEIGANAVSHDLAGDGTNTVRWTSYTDSRLGVCYSRYSGCFISGGSDMRWHVNEFDIEFDSTRNWYFGTVAPTSNQFDFESVATHELGHGHQLGHVRASAKVMHYSISNGQRKPQLVTTDIAAGNYVRNKSVSTSVCNKTVMSAGICPGLPPIAAFTPSSLSVCPAENITFTDNTSGDVTSLSWDFGAGATPASAVGSGPHTVSYAAGGTKSVRLIAVNINGEDTATQTVTVKPDVIAQPISFSGSDTICPGVVRYTIDAVDDATGYEWNVASGGSIIEDGITTIRVNWQDTGVHLVSVFAEGECVDSDPREEQVFVLASPDATFTSIENGLTATFTNTSTYGESYSWDFGDGNTSSETNPVHKYGDKGEYQVSLSATNRCGDSEINEDVLVAFGANVLEIEKVLNIYPNPVRVGSKISIKEGSFTSFAIYNAEGKLVQSGDLLGKNIVLNNGSTGVFMLVLQEADRVVRHKITVVE